MKEFIIEGYNAAIKTLYKNLLGMDTVEMLDVSEVNYKVHKNALSYLMFLRRKQSGDHKGRVCIEGRPQREYITKEESSFLTVSI